MTPVGFQADLRLCWPKLTIKGRSYHFLIVLSCVCYVQTNLNEICLKPNWIFLVGLRQIGKTRDGSRISGKGVRMYKMWGAGVTLLILSHFCFIVIGYLKTGVQASPLNPL